MSLIQSTSGQTKLLSAGCACAAPTCRPASLHTCIGRRGIWGQGGWPRCAAVGGRAGPSCSRSWCTPTEAPPRPKPFCQSHRCCWGCRCRLWKSWPRRHRWIHHWYPSRNDLFQAAWKMRKYNLCLFTSEATAKDYFACQSFITVISLIVFRSSEHLFVKLLYLILALTWLCPWLIVCISWSRGSRFLS